MCKKVPGIVAGWWRVLLLARVSSKLLLYLVSLAVGKHHFPVDELFDTVDHFLHQLHFREANSLHVGDVELSANGFGVFSGATSRLKFQFGAALFQKVDVF